MSGELMLRIEDRGLFAAFIVYAIMGSIFLALLPFLHFPPHIGILGIWSLATAYGLFMERKWALYFIVLLFFTATTFSLYTVYGLLAGAIVEGVQVRINHFSQECRFASYRLPRAENRTYMQRLWTIR
jgi:hypothetical protein